MDKLTFKANKLTKSMESLNSFVPLLVQDLSLNGRHGTARAYMSSLRRLTEFTGNKNLLLSDLNPSLLKRYEQHLFKEGCKRNTISLYMRMLRSICNQAQRRGVKGIRSGLFNDVFTGTDSSEKRAVSPVVIRRLREADLSSHPTLEMARDLFLLSFYLRGIPFVDLIRLRKCDINRGILRYRRSKTGRLLTVAVEPCAQEILRKYSHKTSGSPYMLPVICSEGYSGYREYQNALRRYNLHLHKLSELLKLKTNLTSYVARHSWATAAYHEGIPVAVISESLGHASEKVTYTYLASFDNRTLKRANRKIIALIFAKKESEMKSLSYPRKFSNMNFKAYD